MKTLTNKQHIKETILLSLPIVATQIGHVFTGMADNYFLGGIGKTELAAGVSANGIFVLLLVFCIGMSYSSTPLVSSAHVNDNLERKALLFKNSLFLNTSVATLAFIIMFFLTPLMDQMDQPPDVVKLSKPFFDVLVFSMIPISLFFTCKQYAEGLSNTRAAMYISIVGNLLNIVLNYALIYGKWGLPVIGYMGAAWATFIARCFMGFAFLGYIFYNPKTSDIKLFFRKVKVGGEALLSLWKIGINSGMQFTFEVAAFVIALFMAGKFGKEQIDAHGIAITLASFTYMFASGISSASTIRVSNFAAEKNKAEVKKAGNMAVLLVLTCMGFFAIIFTLLNHVLPRFFTNDEAILDLSSKLLLIAAVFQLFDGLQVTSIGMLRGMEDVKFPTYITLLGYWILALPLAYVLGFVCKLEVIGIWWALTFSLVFVGIILYWRFWKLTKT
ncbi:MAG TPA: MATE family efflux transporter [Bacteroidia bacterium]|nr:MATE family efflux transporter [Bacteroidia bacterium]